MTDNNTPTYADLQQRVRELEAWKEEAVRILQALVKTCLNSGLDYAARDITWLLLNTPPHPAAVRACGAEGGCLHVRQGV